jgi:hypothetical protein
MIMCPNGKTCIPADYCLSEVINIRPGIPVQNINITEKFLLNNNV